MVCFTFRTAVSMCSQYIPHQHTDYHWFQLSLNRQEEENVHMISTHVCSRNVSYVSWDQWVCLQTFCI